MLGDRWAFALSKSYRSSAGGSLPSKVQSKPGSSFIWMSSSLASSASASPAEAAPVSDFPRRVPTRARVRSRRCAGIKASGSRTFPPYNRYHLDTASGRSLSMRCDSGRKCKRAGGGDTLIRLCVPDEELALFEKWRPQPKIWSWELSGRVLAILDQQAT